MQDSTLTEPEWSEVREDLSSSVSNVETTQDAPGSSHEVIRFYRANERPWGVLSNLYRCPVVFESELFPSAEHAYQAGKPRKEAVRKWILSAPSPSLVAMAAHGLYTWDVAPGWSQTKFERMRRVLQAKFSQNIELRDLLLGTGDARLVESATVDNLVNRTWGEVNGKGRNMLGVLLMAVREELLHEIADCETIRRRPAMRSGERTEGVNRFKGRK